MNCIQRSLAAISVSFLYFYTNLLKFYDVVFIYFLLLLLENISILLLSCLGVHGSLLKILLIFKMFFNLREKKKKKKHAQ